MQDDFIKNKRQKLETEIVGYQGEGGTKVDDKIELSKMTPVQHRNMFSLLLNPEKHREQLYQESIEKVGDYKEIQEKEEKEKLEQDKAQAETEAATE